MHCVLLLLAIALALVLRVGLSQLMPMGDRAWNGRWQLTLANFLLPPLAIAFTALAVLYMGSHGHMLGAPVGKVGYGLAAAIVAVTVGLFAYLGWQSGRSQQQVRRLPRLTLQKNPVRQLETAVPFAAQIGLWRSELVVSQGLLDTLSAAQLEAVLAHEAAHRYYHDTVCFFWLGGVRRLTTWLPQTEALWQELIFLRELRADRWAANRIDPLLLAESLVQVAQAAVAPPGDCWALLTDRTQVERLEERIDALMRDLPLEGMAEGPAHFPWLWFCRLAIGLPLLTIPFHTF
ncbi:M56 family metallopeptidase [Almyronema epifaneia]|uniref:M56 family metallopeptidase n=1 Tax=Almyronema epifaneia S1 TaxID=2991925 RepID=A0ABW6IIZ1_9CYAN